MLISLAWLRELVPVPHDAREVARRLTSRGLTVDAALAVDDDTVFDLDVPANRPDALGHQGVAREVAAAFGLALSTPAAPVAASGRAVTEDIRVSVDAPDLCGRYTARIVRGVRVGPSPEWVVKRLEACGSRSINNVVDASNLVMLELGQPVHFFDLGTISGAEIRVRRALPGESLTTLDGVVRALDPEMLVIADASRAVALAGVIGGAATEIRETTRDVLIEAAWFAPASVRRTARAFGLSTDASQRFERGCDPEAPVGAQELAARLLTRLAGGVVAPGLIDARAQAASPRHLSVRLSRVARLLGYAPSASEVMAALAAVGLKPVAHETACDVTIPSWRIDLEREVDVIEEIGRHLGYDRIPSRAPVTAPRAPIGGGSDLEERVRDRLAALGFSEAVNYAMIAPGDDAPFVDDGTPEAIPLTNPIAETMSFLRRALAPGLLRAADQNLRRGVSEVRLFEVGRVFLDRYHGQLPDEPLRVALAWSGASMPPHWSEPVRAVDAYDVVGLTEEVLSLVAGDRAFAPGPAKIMGLHPLRSRSWSDESGRPVAWCGPAHPDLAARIGLLAPVFLGEIDLSRAAGRPWAVQYRPVPRVPSVCRDLSIVLGAEAEASRVVAALSAVPTPAPASFAWLDRYEGRPLDPGQVAMTLRVILQPVERTLTDVETEVFRALLIAALESVPGATLRRIDT